MIRSGRLLRRLTAILGREPSDADLFVRALTHSSYVNEHKSPDLRSNERLEFLGDAVLDLAVSRYLFDAYPCLDEGSLTRVRAAVVCESSLAGAARALGLGDLLRLGRGEEADGGRAKPSVLADAFEALVAAVAIDGGLEEASRFALGALQRRIEEASRCGGPVDYKSALQERVQRGGGVDMHYEVERETGPAHERRFTVRVLIGGRVAGRGIGRSKREAEQVAARDALRSLDED